jgi:hypothetical protein
MKRESSISQSNSTKRSKKSTEQSNTLLSYFQPLIPNAAKTKVNSILNYFNSPSESIKLKEEINQVESDILCKKEEIFVSENEDDLKNLKPNKTDSKEAWGAIFANKKQEVVKNEPEIKQEIEEETHIEDKQQKTYRKCPFYKFITGNKAINNFY